MRSWHDIKNLATIDEEDYTGLTESKAAIHILIDDTIASTHLPSNRIVLAGFSQGAALAVFSGYQYTNTLAGIICLSGYLPHSNFPSVIHSSNKCTPGLVLHGLSDIVVRPAAGEKLNSVLKGVGIETVYKTYKGLGHSSNNEEIDEINAFLKKYLP